MNLNLDKLYLDIIDCSFRGFIMEYFFRKIGLFCILIFVISLFQVQAQENRNVDDSLKTLKILKKTLDDIIEANKSNEAANLDVEIDGIIIDQSITKVGRDFYDLFYSLWVAPRNAKNFTITIKEMVLPGLATQIVVLVNDNEVFKQKVQPRYEILEAMSQFANAVTVRYLNNYEKMNAQLEGEDQQGTGIY